MLRHFVPTAQREGTGKKLVFHPRGVGDSESRGPKAPFSGWKGLGALDITGYEIAYFTGAVAHFSRFEALEVFS